MRLGYLIKKWRGAEKIGIREAARQIGTSHATLSRLENGLPCNSDTLASVIIWMIGEDKPRKAKEA